MNNVGIWVYDRDVYYMFRWIKGYDYLIGLDLIRIRNKKELWFSSLISLVLKGNGNFIWKI